ncbi:MAG: DUF3667 domain-containing protein [Chitinophagaceae bacterium]|nr:DUF3667 domain-containing protein [Chitinophagaceae bacterium]
MPTHICANCNNEFSGNFCNNCGQKLAHRITMGYIGHEISHAFTHTDKGFFHLMAGLFRKPGKVIREYIIENKRKRYGTPFQYILIIGALATFIMVNTHFMESSMQVVGMGEGNAGQMQMMQKVSEFQGRYYNLIMLLQLPFFALATFWLYGKHKLNYAEHLTLHTFITAQTTLISIVLILLLFILDRSNINLMRSFTAFVAIIAIVYQISVCMQFFRQKNIAGFFRAMGAYLLGLFLFFMVIGVLAFAGGIIYAIITR